MPWQKLEIPANVSPAVTALQMDRLKIYDLQIVTAHTKGDFMLGKTISRYKILENIGMG